MAENNFVFDQVIGGPDVRDWTALVRAGHDQSATDSFKVDWYSIFLL